MKKYLLVTLFVFLCLPALVWAKVNINTAGSDELQTLNGIGPAKAADIISYRQANGPFSRIEDIMNVSGIKQATFDKIKDSITVSGDDNPSPDASPTSDGNQTTTDLISTHSSPDELSTLENSPSLAVSIGRERAVATGSNLLFRATAKGLKSGGRNNGFDWNFGDGFSARGQSVYHTYRYPSTYNVVVTLTQGEDEAVARTTVLVTDPKIKLETAEIGGAPAVRLKNLAATEVNLGDWRLVSGRRFFALPADTIIGPGIDIAVPFLATTASLVAPSGQVFATFASADPATLAALQIQLLKLQTVAARLTAAPPAPVGDNSPAEASLSVTVADDPPPATTTVLELPAAKPWWQFWR